MFLKIRWLNKLLASVSVKLKISNSTPLKWNSMDSMVMELRFRRLFLSLFMHFSVFYKLRITDKTFIAFLIIRVSTAVEKLLHILFLNYKALVEKPFSGQWPLSRYTGSNDKDLIYPSVKPLLFIFSWDKSHFNNNYS
jgi:hypothetical protein